MLVGGSGQFCRELSRLAELRVADLVPQDLHQADDLLFSVLLLRPNPDEPAGVTIGPGTVLASLVEIPVEEAPDRRVNLLPRLVQRPGQQGGITDRPPEILDRPVGGPQGVLEKAVPLEVVAQV